MSCCRTYKQKDTGTYVTICSDKYGHR
jgi:hypothetical protein